jgi:hypothetical protein
MKILSVGVELFHADWRTAMAKLKVAFCDFTKLPEKDEEERKRHEGAGIGRRETNEEDTNECRNELINHRMKELVAT